MKKINLEKLHDKHYKLLLLIPLSLFLFSFFYLGIFYSQNQDIVHKDVSLTGGTLITIYGSINKSNLVNGVSSKLDSLNVKETKNLISGKTTSIILETKTSPGTSRKVLQNYLGYNLTNENSSFEFTGAGIGKDFYKQLIMALVFAFILMALVVFLIFRTFVPSFAVVLSAFGDMIMTLTLIDILNIRISIAGVIAFLMLIGYSVDTDILLTTRVLKRTNGSLNERIFSSFKTGTTMTLTSLFAILSALVVIGPVSGVLYQIFLVLVLGLSFDLINTWITNVSILKWYVLRRRNEK